MKKEEPRSSRHPRWGERLPFSFIIRSFIHHSRGDRQKIEQSRAKLGEEGSFLKGTWWAKRAREKAKLSGPYCLLIGVWRELKRKKRSLFWRVFKRREDARPLVSFIIFFCLCCSFFHFVFLILKKWCKLTFVGVCHVCIPYHFINKFVFCQIFSCV